MFNQRIGGAFDLAGKTQSMQHGSDERSFSRAEIASQVDDQAWPDYSGKPLCQGGCRCLVGEKESAIIGVMQNGTSTMDYATLAVSIRAWGRELGFQAVGISDTHLEGAERHLLDWLASGCHGGMDYMAKHGTRRSRPDELVPGTLRVISVRMNYLPPDAKDSWEVIDNSECAFISRYALGRDYHKVLRNRLEKLAGKIREAIGPFAGRVFVDSAPVLEVELAHKANLGWRGKHTLLLTREHGSWFFLGEIYVDLPLPLDEKGADHCGTCERCIEVCPTQAIVAPYRLDARRCISYLTIEHKGSIPVELRALIGNRIYGCDDCQLVCPWNRFAHVCNEPDFTVRHGLDDVALVELFAWDEGAFERNFAGNAIYRIGHEQWLRNLAVALGNAPPCERTIQALKSRLGHGSSLVREHVSWALEHLCGNGD